MDGPAEPPAMGGALSNRLFTPTRRAGVFIVIPDRRQVEIVPRPKVDLGGVEVFDTADIAPHQTGPQPPGRHPGGAQIIANIRGRKTTGRAPVAGAVYLARSFQLLLIPGRGNRQDIAEAQPAPAAQAHDAQREVIAGGHIKALHLLNRQIVQQGHDMTAVVEVGP